MWNKCVILFLLMIALSGCKDNGCISFNGESLNNATTMVPINNHNMVNTGLNAAVGKLVRISVVTSGLYSLPQKYRAIVRLDPRFAQPVVYLATYDNNTNNYVVNWAQLPLAVPPTYPSNNTTPSILASNVYETRIFAFIGYLHVVSIVINH